MNYYENADKKSNPPKASADASSASDKDKGLERKMSKNKSAEKKSNNIDHHKDELD